jgi:hypothetical protein
MSCPYFEEGYIGTCGASESRYVPSIERMEIHCFKQTYLFPLILLTIVSFSKGVMFRKNSRLASVLQI